MIRAAAGLAVALPVLLSAAPAGAAPVPPPQFSVTVDDGVDEAAAGDVLDYVVTVRNEGSGTASADLTVTVPGATAIQADGAADAGAAVWRIDELPGGESREFRLTATAAEPTGDAYQVLATATVSALDEPESVLARAVDADTIPGAAAPAPVRGLTGTTVAAADTTTPWVVGGAAALLALGATVWAVRRRSSAA